jgi:NADPH:quinone reductase-like Zn-dependent oxidoreductase
VSGPFEYANAVQQYDQRIMIGRAARCKVWPRLPARDSIAPLIDSVYPLEDAARVHEYFDSGVHVGKIILVP